MWLGIVALLNKLLDLINPWSARWANKATEADKRVEKAKEEMQAEVKNEGQESVDRYLNSKSRKRRR